MGFVFPRGKYGVGMSWKLNFPVVPNCFLYITAKMSTKREEGIYNEMLMNLSAKDPVLSHMVPGRLSNTPKLRGLHSASIEVSIRGSALIEAQCVIKSCARTTSVKT